MQEAWNDDDPLNKKKKVESLWRGKKLNLCFAISTPALEEAERGIWSIA